MASDWFTCNFILDLFLRKPFYLITVLVLAIESQINQFFIPILCSLNILIHFLIKLLPGWSANKKQTLFSIGRFSLGRINTSKWRGQLKWDFPGGPNGLLWRRVPSSCVVQTWKPPFVPFSGFPARQQVSDDEKWSNSDQQNVIFVCEMRFSRQQHETHPPRLRLSASGYVKKTNASHSLGLLLLCLVFLFVRALCCGAHVQAFICVHADVWVTWAMPGKKMRQAKPQNVHF